MTAVRRFGKTSAASLLGVAVTVLTTCLIAPEWTQAAGLDLWHVPELRSQLEAENTKKQEIDADLEESRNRIVLKQQIIDELVAGTATLKEATAQFLELNQGHEASMLAIRKAYKGASDEEKTARNVITYAAWRLNGSFVQRVQLLARLTRELRQMSFEEKTKHV